MIVRLPLLTLAPGDPDLCSAGISRHREDVELSCLRPTLPHLALGETARMDEGGTSTDSFAFRPQICGLNVLVLMVGW